MIPATAFHWITPDVGYQIVAQALKPHGTLALFWNRHVQAQVSADFFRCVPNVYQDAVPEMAERFPGLMHPDSVPSPVKTEIDRSGLFGEVMVLKYRWETEDTAKAYVELLNTYSDHIALEKEIRTKLFEGIQKLVESGLGHARGTQMIEAGMGFELLWLCCPTRTPGERGFRR